MRNPFTIITIISIVLITIGSLVHISNNRQQVREGSWLVCGAGFFYDLDTASESTYQTFEWLANECAPRYQDERVEENIPLIDKELRSWNRRPVSYIISEHAVIIYPNQIVINWQLTPEEHHRMLIEALAKRDAIASR